MKQPAAVELRRLHERCDQWRDIHDAVVADSDKVYALLRQALEALDSDNPDIQLRAATYLRQALETKQEPVALPCVYITSQKDGGNCYGDGTVYRGQRSKDSETPTLNLQSTMEMWERAYEQVCEERDAIVKDSNKAYELLRWAETEMRYAKWGTRLNDQHGRTDVYTAIVEFLK